MTPEPCVLLWKPENAYEILSFNRESGKLVIRSQYNVELTITTELADQNGYKAVKGMKVADPKVEGRTRFIV